MSWTLKIVVIALLGHPVVTAKGIKSQEECARMGVQFGQKLRKELGLPPTGEPSPGIFICTPETGA